MNPIAERIINYMSFFDKISEKEQYRLLSFIVSICIEKIKLNPVKLKIVWPKKLKIKLAHIFDEFDEIDEFVDRFFHDNYKQLDDRLKEIKKIEKKIMNDYFKARGGYNPGDVVDDDQITTEERQLFDEVDILEKRIEKISEQIKNELLNDLKWDFVPFPNCKTLSMTVDPNNPNTKFQWTITNPTGITLKQFTECAYRLKSSKCNCDGDCCMQFYNGIELFSKEDGKMTFQISFDG